ncbi:ABC transporter permease [Neobacillus sp. NPDC058068]|uniref:ABC transporter permease n=1 Tax=Neobacillus sp. NPDC058068 TaxID=3346325 RepID=UPI0036DCF8EE
MRFVLQVLKELAQNFHLVLSLVSYDIKSKYRMHYLGIFWELITPILKIAVYWFVFGIGLRQGAPINGVPYFLWLVAGLIPWFFISPAVTQGCNSVYEKVNLVSKMKFPISVLPGTKILSHFRNFLIMLIVLLVILLANGFRPGIYLLQLPYYLLCTLAFLFAFTLLGSTISIMFRDFQLMLQNAMRLLFFITPVIWDRSHLPSSYQALLKLNPFSYLIEGYRFTFLGQGWFYTDKQFGLYFWSITLLFLFIGSFIHLKFRSKFIDYL